MPYTAGKPRTLIESDSVTRSISILCCALVLFISGMSCRDDSGGTPSAAGDEGDAGDAKHAHTNRLARETSPYLLQHAHNPVDWYPWGEEAFEKAREEGKPILLSIGYSACHWCHVMEHESFENEEIAAIMNELFVNIKVDREERPDVDGIYMTAVQIMTGRGGWPLTVFLTPEKKPFFGGTYFPPEDQGGRPGFRTLLGQVSGFYQESKNDPETVAKMEELLERIRESSKGPAGAESLAGVDVEVAVNQFNRSYDRRFGGFGGAPKFPPSARLMLLLRHYYETGDAQTLNVIKGTLDGMLKGGMYDQLGGGFHRYSVDEKWLIPHFEKMLYDNALLAPVYLAAYQMTGEPEYRRITDEILGYLMNEMSFDRGGFFSSEDADSEGEEGKFYVWTPDEVRAVVGADDADLVMARYGVTAQGNFEHNTTTLFLARTIEDIAAETGRSESDVREALAKADSKMLAVRAKRIRPGLDDKALASWNALAISAFARAGRGLGDARYVERAKKAARFIQENMVKGDILMHTYKEGEAKIPGYLDDYTFYVQALVDLYETTFDVDYLERAVKWNDRTMELFMDPAGGGFHYSGDENEELIAQAKNFFDGSVPSGNSIAAMNLARLERYTGNKRYEMELQSLFSTFAGPMGRSPGGTAAMLCAFAFHTRGPREIVIVGGDDDPATEAFVETVSRRFIPDAIFVYWDGKDRRAAKLMPILEGKENVDETTAFICRDYVCDAPITSAETLQTAMAAPYETGESAR